MSAPLLYICRYLQRMDRNGDALQMYEEYLNGEISKEVVIEVCDRVLHEWLGDTLPDDYQQAKELNMHINLLKGVEA